VPDKHPAILHQSQAENSPVTNYYGTTFHFFEQSQHSCGFAVDGRVKRGKSDKDGLGKLFADQDFQQSIK
jgi:hypothetical protein